jgi:hypothetical protein
MQLDEWNQGDFDEWQAPVDFSLPHLPMDSGPAASGAAAPGRFPEVEIGSSSDDDAPRAPQSAQLARENLQLRTRVSALVAQSKALEQSNASMKRQLSKCRHSFASRIKGLFK